MRIVIISVPAHKKPIPDYINALQKGMASMGHQVDVLDAWTEDNFRLPSYEYIVVVAESTTLFGGKLPSALSKVLSIKSGLGGKKSAAFIKKTSPFTTKALSNLMFAMEKEGMMVNWSEVIFKPPHAEALGKRIGS